jgi:hypothetical protein
LPGGLVLHGLNRKLRLGSDWPTLPDDLGGLLQDGRRDREVHGPGSLEIDDEVEGRGQLDRQVGRLDTISTLDEKIN